MNRVVVRCLRSQRVGACRWRRSLSYKLMDKSEEQQLAAFPEYQQAMLNQKQGNIKQSIVLLSRVYEVLQHALGADTPLSNSILLQLASLHRSNGDTNKAIKLIKSQTFSGLGDKVNSHVLLSSTELLQGNSEQAIIYAQKAVNMCENEQDHANPDNSLFSSAYSSLGLSSLFNGDLHSAETYLHMAARWAQTPYEHIMTLNNTGALLWYQLACGYHDAKEVFNVWSYETNDYMHDMKYKELSKEAPLSPLSCLLSSKVINIESHPLVQSALGGWHEGLEYAVNLPPSEQDINTLIAQVTCMINNATFLILANKVQESNEKLSEAIRLLSPHEEDMRLQPIVGAVLRRIATIHMQATQAVTAEGLYNAAMSKLSSPWGKNDLRYKYEAALAKGYYGQLLSKWDKREKTGEEHRKKAKKEIDDLVKFTENKLVLSPLVIVP